MHHNAQNATSHHTPQSHDQVQGGTGHQYPSQVRGDSSAQGYSNVVGAAPVGRHGEVYDLPIGQGNEHGTHGSTTHGGGGLHTASHGTAHKPTLMDKIKDKVAPSSNTNAPHGSNTHQSTPGAYPNTAGHPSTIDKIADKITPGHDQYQHHATGGTQNPHAPTAAHNTQQTHNPVATSTAAAPHTSTAGHPSTMEKVVDKITPGNEQYHQQHATGGAYGAHATQGSTTTGMHAGNTGHPSTTEKIVEKVIPGNHQNQTHAAGGAYGAEGVQPMHGTQASHGGHATQGTYDTATTGTHAGATGHPSTTEKIVDKITPGNHQSQQYPAGTTHSAHNPAYQPTTAGAVHHGNPGGGGISTTDKLLNKMNPSSGTTQTHTHSSQQQQHGHHLGGTGGMTTEQKIFNSNMPAQNAAHSTAHPQSGVQHPYGAGAGGAAATGHQAGTTGGLTTKDKIVDMITPDSNPSQHQQQQHTVGHQQHGGGGPVLSARHPNAAHDAPYSTHGTDNSSANSGGTLSNIKDKIMGARK